MAGKVFGPVNDCRGNKKPPPDGVLRAAEARGLVVAGCAVNRDFAVGVAARMLFGGAVLIAVIISLVAGAIFLSDLMIAAVLVARDSVAAYAAPQCFNGLRSDSWQRTRKRAE